MIKAEVKKIKNEEKYRKQIAKLITFDNGYGCSLFSKNSECDLCALEGICLHEDKVEKWLKSYYCKEKG